ncbi:MAG: FkbM family methyltransferase [bacterium]
MLSLKRLLRSRSWDYTLNYNRPGPVRTFRWQGHTVHYRPGTSDANLIYDVLLRPSRHESPQSLIRTRSRMEYWVPPQVAPQVILDIGGNVGLTTVYYSHLFPDARIHVFEPVPENFEMLKLNTEPLANVTTYPVALGKEDTTASINACREEGNEGGYTLYGLDSDPDQTRTIEVRNVATLMREIGLTRVDLLKIDTEGAEFDILTTMDPAILENVRWIVGELHSHRDFELLHYLSQWFDIDIHKSLRFRLCQFNARNSALANEIPWTA